MDVVQSDASLDLAARAVEAVESLLEGLEQTAALGPRETNNVLYRGLVAFIVQLAFVRLAEARGVLPKTYPPASNRMSVHQICATLADLPANGPTSTAAQLVHLFRAIHDGVLQEPVSLGDLLGSRGSVLAKLDDVAVATVLRQLAAFQDPNLDIEHLGTLYESLMGYEVKQTTSAAARVGKRGVWVEIEALRTLPPRRRAHWLKTTCGVSANQQKSIEALLDEHANEIVCAQAISALGTSTSPARRWAGSGSLVLVSGTRRRLSGSHYTPRVLTKHIVAQALAPVLSSLGARPTAEQILNLTICDPAMGSGAFLLEACRQLSEHVVAAWKRHGCLEDVAARHGLPLRYARFLVAQRCLHGVDKNPDAVELAKLSLWLLAANCEQDFTFVDHTLRHGDSLVGLDREQVLGFSWHRSPPVTAIAELINKAPHSPATRQSLRLIADLCIGAFFAHTTIKARNLERDRRLVLVTRWLAGETQLKPALLRLAATIRERHAPLHWWLEFPGISTGMDA
ncbi:MAG: DNA methyltransferase, partial [Nannocystaceae bacterium]